MKGLTLARLRKTGFGSFFKNLALGTNISKFDYERLLSLAIIFINESDQNVQRLGYRIIVFYCNKNKNYKPLYDVSLNNGLIPIVKFIENMSQYQRDFDSSFFNTFYSSFIEMYNVNDIYLSDQQLNLFSFSDEHQNETVSIIAPTSYGKSELIISSLNKRKKGNVCILVPTKALLAQTKKRLMNAQINNISKIITHPEMYLDGETNITAILTQERLLRLLQKKSDLSFDLVFVDEAHNLLENNDRNILLATAILILEKRNNNVIFKFLTPFLENSSNLCVINTNYIPKSFRITEYMKTERLYIYDFRNSQGLKLYDQFINDFFNIETENFADDIDLILKYKSNKNIIYLNKPSDLENFSMKLSSRMSNTSSKRIEKACEELSNYFHKDYSLISCLKKGLTYHHGSVPDNVRIYIEDLYSTEKDIDFIVTSSTLLEGVNLPADNLFLLDNKKGKGNLSPSQFKNLIGRVCRFSEVFSPESGSLKMLEPNIFLIVSDYYSKNANIESYISRCMKIDKIDRDNPTNILLDKVQITDQNRIEKNNVVEFIENFEPGVVNNYSNRYAQTEIGLRCYANNIIEIDIIEHEKAMQKIVNSKRNSNITLNNTGEIFTLFSELFFPFIKEGDKYNNLKRLSNGVSRRFYKMFLNWRIKNASYGEMITSFLKYWRKLEREGRDTIVYVGKWGDKKRDGFQNLWSDIKEKDQKQRVNLAIVRIKDEQDFLDNILIKFIEVLNDLDFLEKDFYEKIKYGTSDKAKITLIKNGLSIGLVNLIVDDYINYVDIDTNLHTFNIKTTIIDEMIDNEENDILIYEARYNIKSKSFM